MKKIFTVIIILALAAVAIFSATKMFGQHYNKSKADQKVKISWSEVNIRESHSTKSDIIDTLQEGDTVILTGYSYEYIGNGESFDSWVEVITSEDGVHGWIVTESIDW